MDISQQRRDYRGGGQGVGDKIDKEEDKVVPVTNCSQMSRRRE